jgi:YD repeat-containing protein
LLVAAVLMTAGIARAQAPVTFQYSYDAAGQLILATDSSGNSL